MFLVDPRSFYRRSTFPKNNLQKICFTFCDPLRLEPQCSLSRHRRRVCSRCFRAGRSCLLPAVCTPQGRTGAEGFPAFSSGQRSPRNRARSWSRNFTKSGPKIFPKFVPKFARKIWACFLQYEKFPSQFLSPLGKNFTPHFGNSI